MLLLCLLKGSREPSDPILGLASDSIRHISRDDPVSLFGWVKFIEP